MKQIRIVLADSHHLVRHSLATMLNEGDFHVVGEASDGPVMLELVDQLRPDVLVMAMEMPDHRPLEAARRLHKEHPGLGIIALATAQTPLDFLPLLESPLSGCVLKSDNMIALKEAIRTVARGHRWVSPQVTEKLLAEVRAGSPSESVTLTPRELEVLRLVGLGFSNETIAAELDLATSTVANYVSRIRTKVGVETRIQAALYALSKQLVQIEEIQGRFGRDRSAR